MVEFDNERELVQAARDRLDGWLYEGRDLLAAVDPVRAVTGTTTANATGGASDTPVSVGRESTDKPTSSGAGS
jgi:hypothetical protein